MPTTQQLRKRLLDKLKELFQLNQPDLDFGFYRIMHAKAEQVERFIQEDLLQVIADTFGQADEKRRASVKLELDQAIQQALDFGAPDPEKAPAVMEARKKYDLALATDSVEGDIYDHLYRFFERYYDGGDFISRRYYARETSGKAAPFAIPYNGEEVKLHWANADQYYIKTAEHFSNYTVDLNQAKEIREARESGQGDLLGGSMKDEPARVHFRIIDASEGEHGNIKASDNSKRFFVIYKKNPIELNESGELIINFEYRPDPDRSGQEGSWRDKLNTNSVEVILANLECDGLTSLSISDEPARLRAVSSHRTPESHHRTPESRHRTPEEICEILKFYHQLFTFPAPTEKDKKRPLLAKYLNKYTARNTMDYFIHKDLGGFLARELDFYIKNEFMRLDDIMDATAPAVESYLDRIKVFRKIACQLIDFLAQLENFQKKLWLKKKFVVETSWCIRLDLIPEEFYPEIAANKTQLQEWKQLGVLDSDSPLECDGLTSLLINEDNNPTSSQTNLECDGLTSLLINEDSNPAGSQIVETPHQNTASAKNLNAPIKSGVKPPHSRGDVKPSHSRTMMIDTRHFDPEFTARLLDAIEDLEEKTDGLLVHSENFQALNFLNQRFAEQIDFIYVDPPYNTDATEIVYKNGYKDSSWLSLLADRTQIAANLLKHTGVNCTTIDDVEHAQLRLLLDQKFSKENYLATVLIRNNPSGRSTVKGFSINHEFALFYALDSEHARLGRLSHTEVQTKRYDLADDHGSFEWENFRKSSAGSDRSHRPKQFFPIYVSKDTGEMRVPNVQWNDAKKIYDVLEVPSTHEIIALPIDDSGNEKVWRWGLERTNSSLGTMEARVSSEGTSVQLYGRKYLNTEGVLPRTWWDKPEYSARDSGTRTVRDLIPEQDFDFPKSVQAVADAINVGCPNHNGCVLDYFGGSGTTAHSVIHTNRVDGRSRKVSIIEMGEHFNTVLIPRLKKVTFTPDWKDGRPKRLPTKEEAERSPRIFKVVRLESYEDTLNNLVIADKTLDDLPRGLQREYTLNYMLDVETKGSPSLLNLDAFSDPTAYTLTVKKPGSEEYATRTVDLAETFNYLIGMRVDHMAAPVTLNAAFKREEDPELPDSKATKLIVDGKIREAADGSWWFRKVEGWVPADPLNPNNGQKNRVLIVWRKLTGDLERDNLMLDEWFTKIRVNPRDREFDIIYVNGSNNLQNIATEADNWKVRLIEEEFMKKMWEEAAG